MKKALFAAALLLLSDRASAQEAYIGEVRIFPYFDEFCPAGWAPADGGLLPIAQNTALFSLLGTKYGGNGQTTFALPFFKPVFSADGAGARYCIAQEGIFPPRP